MKLVGESTQFPREHIGVYASSLAPIPPRLLYQRRHIRGSQLKVTDFSSYRGKHILVMTGTADADHPRKLDEAIVEWLNQNGANADFIYLGDRGIVGNGHIMMLEKNSDALSEQVVSWITAPSRKGSAPFSTAAPYKSHLPPRRRATRADRRQTRPCPPCARQSSNSSLDPRRSDARIAGNGFAAITGVSKICQSSASATASLKLTFHLTTRWGQSLQSD